MPRYFPVVDETMYLRGASEETHKIRVVGNRNDVFSQDPGYVRSSVFKVKLGIPIVSQYLVNLPT